VSEDQEDKEEYNEKEEGEEEDQSITKDDGLDSTIVVPTIIDRATLKPRRTKPEPRAKQPVDAGSSQTPSTSMKPSPRVKKDESANNNRFREAALYLFRSVKNRGTVDTEAQQKRLIEIYSEYYHPKKALAERRDPGEVDHFFVRNHPVSKSRCVCIRFKDKEKAFFTTDTLSCEP